MTLRTVVALLVLAVSHAAAQPNATRMVTVDGHAMRVQVLGLENRQPGRPVIVLEAGIIQSLDAWLSLPRALAEIAPVIAYDRAGLGQSAWDNKAPTPRHVTTRLHNMLQQVGAEPPYLLVGYSWGGVLVRYFAGYYPNEIAGIVYVDPGPTVTQSVADNLVPFEAIGAGRAGYDAYWRTFGALFERMSPAGRAEFGAMRSLMESDLAQRDLRPVPNVPVVLIIAAKYLHLEGIQLPYDTRAHFEADLRHRIKKLEDWVLSSSRGTLIVSNHTTHAIPREDPDLIVWAVRRVFAHVNAPR
ncbi:MAG TPA: alpha/beta fold hydrolase [Gemmatimonadaceae bacterium]|nr:alpha/beta fold hydrolase [Gemmatimonadaceae bacterium]